MNCQQLKQDLNKIRTVVIDAGHGGKDSGALGKKSKEKDIVLAIALKTGKYIKKYLPDVKVVYTRTTDVFIPLDERADIANKNQADLFISIHANSNPNIHAFGTETYAMGLHKTQGNLEVAKKENSVITFEDNYETKYAGFDPNNVESYIMISLEQDIYLDYSLTAASLIQSQFRERAKRKDRGVKQAGFLVLWKTSTPSILIETGFVSNPHEEEYLMSEQGQDYLASAIFRAFRNYKDLIEGAGTNLVKNSEPYDEPGLLGTDSSESISIADSSENSNKKLNKTGTLNINNSSDIPSIGNEEKKIEVITDSNNYLDTKFKVQILYSENHIDLNDSIFHDFNDIEEIETSGKYKYVVGSANTYPEAVEYSKWVKSRYPDAFIVAVSNGKIVPLSQALKN